MIVILLLASFLVGCQASIEIITPEVSPSPPMVTEPGPMTDSASGFLVIADFGGGNAQQDVADAMLAWKRAGYRVNAIVTAGDNVYDRGEPSKYEVQLDRPYAPLGVPMYIAIGNHDEPNRAAMLQHMKMQNPPSKVSIGEIDIFFLNSNSVDAVQTQWLTKALDSTAKIKIVVYHHPAYSCGKHGNTKEVIEKWVPVIEKGNVDIVFSGHDHNYQRFNRGSVQWVVSGGGGRDITPLKPDCAATRAATVNQFVSVETRSNGSWRMRAVDTMGNIIDEVEGE